MICCQVGGDTPSLASISLLFIIQSTDHLSLSCCHLSMPVNSSCPSCISSQVSLVSYLSNILIAFPHERDEGGREKERYKCDKINLSFFCLKLFLFHPLNILLSKKKNARQKAFLKDYSGSTVKTNLKSFCVNLKIKNIKCSVFLRRLIPLKQGRRFWSAISTDFCFAPPPHPYIIIFEFTFAIYYVHHFKSLFRKYSPESLVWSEHLSNVQILSTPYFIVLSTFLAEVIDIQRKESKVIVYK